MLEQISGRDLIKEVALALLRPANNLLSTIDAVKEALKVSVMDITDEQVDTIVNTALDSIRGANELEKKTIKMCDEKGISYRDFMNDIKADMKAKGIDIDKMYKEFKDEQDAIDEVFGKLDDLLN